MKQKNILNSLNKNSKKKVDLYQISVNDLSLKSKNSLENIDKLNFINY